MKKHSALAVTREPSLARRALTSAPFAPAAGGARQQGAPGSRCGSLPAPKDEKLPFLYSITELGYHCRPNTNECGTVVVLHQGHGLVQIT